MHLQDFMVFTREKKGEVERKSEQEQRKNESKTRPCIEVKSLIEDIASGAREWPSLSIGLRWGICNKHNWIYLRDGERENVFSNLSGC